MWNKVKLFWSRTNRWHRVLALFLIVELRCIPGGQLGFQCNDPALSHQFTGDTINWKWLLSTTAFLPLAVMLVVERKYHKNEKTSTKARNQALFWYKEYFFGFLLNTTMVQTLKLLVGAPRPHFFDTCQPEEAFSCQDSEYVPSYTCTKINWQHQSDKSFPSGHTSLALHAGVFIAYYLHRRLAPSRALLSLQSASLLVAAYCCVSRMTDHRHHWWDVLAGAAIAAPILLYTITSLCKNFECPYTEEPKQSNRTSHSAAFTETSNNVTVTRNNVTETSNNFTETSNNVTETSNNVTETVT